MSPTYLAEGTLGDSYLNYVEPALSEKGPSEPVVLQKNRNFQIKKIERVFSSLASKGNFPGAERKDIVR